MRSWADINEGVINKNIGLEPLIDVSGARDRARVIDSVRSKFLSGRKSRDGVENAVVKQRVGLCPNDGVPSVVDIGGKRGLAWIPDRGDGAIGPVERLCG